ncbi:MAG TPA: iron chelate uptake ABC transporter family permease subunit [Gaiellaceae bacterium]
MGRRHAQSTTRWPRRRSPARNVHTIVPFAVAGLVGAYLLSSRLNLLALGEDLPRGLGQNVTRTRF